MQKIFLVYRGKRGFCVLVDTDRTVQYSSFTVQRRLNEATRASEVGDVPGLHYQEILILQ